MSYLARIGNNLKKKNAYDLVITIILLAAGLPCMLFVLIGDKILLWLMGDQWVVAGKYLQILGIWGFGQILYGICAILSINEEQTLNWIKSGNFIIVTGINFAALILHYFLMFILIFAALIIVDLIIPFIKDVAGININLFEYVTKIILAMRIVFVKMDADISVIGDDHIPEVNKRVFEKKDTCARRDMDKM